MLPLIVAGLASAAAGAYASHEQAEAQKDAAKKAADARTPGAQAASTGISMQPATLGNLPGAAPVQAAPVVQPQLAGGSGMGAWMAQQGQQQPLPQANPAPLAQSFQTLQPQPQDQSLNTGFGRW